MSTARRVYVISDLHLGGLWAAPEKQDRGFRMMTHPHVLAEFIRTLAARTLEWPTELVINGDFLDFLAEQHTGKDRWIPFIENISEAERCFDDLSKREGDSEVFDALNLFVKRGHALTLVLGNHDVELCLPAVRRAFEKRIGIGFRQACRFLYDGEAYEVGDALIEHGNRYDPVNVVTHDKLRRLRSLQSRRQFQYQQGQFTSPAGSALVAEVMNPLKVNYPFIDLLKPESEPLFALVLALEPNYRGKLKKLVSLASLAPEAIHHRLAEPALPSMPGDIASTGQSTGVFLGDLTDRAIKTRSVTDENELRLLLSTCLPAEIIDELLENDNDPAAAVTDGDISFAPRVKGWLGLAKLLASRKSTAIRKRLLSVQQALGALDEDRTFDQGYETGKRYREAAEELSSNYRTIVFGHTHHAKAVTLESGATYFNSGTWANRMRFPQDLFEPDREEALLALTRFFEDLRENRLEQYVEFCPTYILLEVDDNNRTHGELCQYESGKAF